MDWEPGERESDEPSRGDEARLLAAGVLEAAACDISRAWVGRLRAGLYRDRSDLGLEALLDHAPPLLDAVASALRAPRPLERDWAQPAVEHAELRLSQQVSLDKLLDELLLLRAEIWRTLRHPLAVLPVPALFELVERLDRTFDTLVCVSADTYGREQARLGELLRSLLESTDQGVFGLDPHGRCTFVNRAATRLLGFRSEQLLGQSMHALIHHTRKDGSPYPAEQCPVDRTFRRGEGARLDDELLWRRDGSAFPAEYSSFPIHGEGEVLGTVVTFADISERKRAEAALLESERRYRVRFETAFDAVLVADAEGRLLDANHRAAQMTGYSREELIGMEVFDLPPPERVAESRELLAALLEQGHLAGEYPVRRKDGTLIEIELSASGDGTGQYQLALRDVTERKRFEAERRHSLEQIDTQRRLLEAVIEQMPAPVVVATPTGELIVKNAQVARVFGPGVSGLSNVTEGRAGVRGLREDGSPYGPGDWPLARSLASGEVVGGELIEIARDGADRAWVSVSSAPVRDRDGRIFAAVVVAPDITERIQTLHALQRSERRFRATFEQAAVGTANVGLDGGFLEVNARLAELLGYRRRELLGRTFHQVTHPDDLRADLEQLERLLSGEIPTYSLDKRFVRRDGSVFWANITVSLLRRPSGEPEYLIGILQDIDRRKRAEAERDRLLCVAQRRAAELDATIGAAPAGLVLYSPQAQILRLNDVAEGLLCYTAADHGRPLAERAAALEVHLADGRPLQPEQSPVARALRGEVVRDQVLFWRRPDGSTVWVLSGARSIRGPGGELLGAVASFADITGLHELQEQRDDILRAVSHDLRNPLATVKGHAELLVRRLERAGLEPERKGAQSVLAGAARMDRMIQDLLDSVRSESGRLTLHPRRIALPAFVREVLANQALTLEVERVRIVDGEGRLEVRADPARLERILVNLLSNALKYSAPGTEVRVSFAPKGDQVCTSVTDRGQGIAPDELPHLFERYFRSRSGRERRGVGLGLYITRALVEAQGGSIRVETEPGRGATFSFSLPAA